MQDVFAEAGIRVTQENKKEIDRYLHDLVGVEYKQCPAAWKKIKELKGDESWRQKLVENLRAGWSE